MKPSCSTNKKPAIQILINEDWLCDSIQTPKSLLQCPICFHIALQPVECKKCCRLFCKQDYINYKSNKDSCPLCGIAPWEVKDTIHIAYRDIMDKLLYRCKICEKEGASKSKSCKNILVNGLASKNGDNLLNQQKFRQHLLKNHNTVLQQHSIKIYKYLLQNPDPQANARLQLNKYQNLQVYYKTVYKKQKQSKFNVMDQQLGLINMDVANMKYTYKDKNNVTVAKNLYKQEVNPKIIGSNPNDLVVGEDYHAWVLQEGKTTIFYLEQNQKAIQDGYQQYKTIPHYSQIHIDLKSTNIRYRIMFDQMKQVNLKTKFQRNIHRLEIKYGEHNQI